VSVITKAFVRVSSQVHEFKEQSNKYSELSLFVLGLGLLYVGGTSLAYAGSGSYGEACNGILLLVEGTFGALITAVAGIGAIIASAVGGFKMAWSLIVVAVGAFILRSYITLFNGDCGACQVC